MTSTDNQQYITVELFNSKIETLMTQVQLGNEKLRSEFQAGVAELNTKIDNVQSGLRAEFQSGFSTLHNEIQDVRADARVNSAQIIDLQHSVYWGIALLALLAAVVPLFRREHKEKKEEAQPQHVLTEERVQELISQALEGRSIDVVGK